MANLPWRLIFQLHIGFELCTYQYQEEGGGWAKARDSTKEVTLDCCNCLNFFFRV